MPTPQKGVAYSFNATLFDMAASGKLKINPTIAAGDFQVSIDNGSLVSLTNTPTVAPAGSAIVRFVLTSAEMNGDRISIQGIDAAGNEWGDFHALLETTVRTVDTVPAAVWDELLSGHAVLGSAGATLSALLGLLDTEIAAILAKVTPLTYTTPGKVDAALVAASDLATAVGQKVADMVLRRVATAIEASADGDALSTASLYGLLMRAEHSDTTTHVGKQTIFRSNGVTELGQVALALDDTAQDITGFGG